MHPGSVDDADKAMEDECELAKRGAIKYRILVANLPRTRSADPEAGHFIFLKGFARYVVGRPPVGIVPQVAG